ncbi:hypothetical protein TGGT1_409420 [Toxoplasma gondii GT1]|uniref:Uncharacterized protein n=1 Tax=Toxoplasma gondii (strain ATCC 50853 / GT1) TaxID=507601 RepID=S7UTN3_TOXGG|nr:hypothetical protein TGGT1_409420 [Toxoplasma gondii GT1]
MSQNTHGRDARFFSVVVFVERRLVSLSVLSVKGFLFLFPRNLLGAFRFSALRLLSFPAFYAPSPLCQQESASSFSRETVRLFTPEFSVSASLSSALRSALSLKRAALRLPALLLWFSA